MARVANAGYDMRMSRHLLTRDADAPAMARALVEDVLGEIGWQAGDAALVVSELVTNSVLHSDASTETPIEVGVELDDRELRVEVCDYGSAHERESVQVTPSITGAAGMGLSIVGVLSDAWGVKGDGQTCVWACFERPEPEPRNGPARM